MLINANDTILFTGDSITDCGRNREKADDLGFGYAAFTGARLQAALASPELKIYNRGISGNRMVDVMGRVEADLLALKPTVVSLFIGINDVWRRYDQNDPTTAEFFAENYRKFLTTIRQKLDARIVLLEPFVLPVPEDRATWRVDLDPKREVVCHLAKEFGTDLIPLDTLFTEAAKKTGPAFWAQDGVHPTAAGHALIAEAWLKNAGLV